MKKSEELYWRIQELDARYQKNKNKRCLKMFLVYFVLFCILFYYKDGNNFVEIGIQAVVITLIVFFVNIIIFIPAYDEGTSENSHIESLKKEYEELVRRGE